MKCFFQACMITSIIINLNCANQRTPTGGPKDTIPPTLISSIPLNETVNFNSNWIELSFNDNINTTALKKNLIISPLTELKYSTTTKKNKVRLTFESPLLDNTTYTFNFLQGITDLTEKNPVVNLSLALSTGMFIDSLKVIGNVRELYKQQPIKNVLVGLYPYSDSLDLITDKPLYFNTTNDSGIYKIQNIKFGKYKIFAFSDDNKNFNFDSENEAYGLKPSFISLSENTSNINLIINTIDSRPLKLISARPFGRYYNIRYSKPITSYRLDYLTPLKYSFLHQFNEDFTNIQIYPPLDDDFNFESDSSQIIINVKDTIGQHLSDTLYIKFLSSEREPNEPTSKIKSISINENLYRISLSFDKPISIIDTLKIFLKTDTLIPLTHVTLENCHWNFNRTRFSFEILVNWNKLQNFLNENLEKYHVIDSLKPSERNLTRTSIVFDSACFKDADGLTLAEALIVLAKKTPEDFGTLHVSAITEKTSFIIQVLDNKDKVVTIRKNQKKFTVPYLVPGLYKLRILIDDNKDGIWSLGNFIDDNSPETIYLYPKTTKISANWEVSIDDLSF